MADQPVIAITLTRRQAEIVEQLLRFSGGTVDEADWPAADAAHRAIVRALGPGFDAVGLGRAALGTPARQDVAGFFRRGARIALRGEHEAGL